MIGLHLDLGKIRAYGSAYLATILYQNENGDFIYTLDGSSNMILDNQSMGGESYDGLLYSGRGIELGALNDVEFPVHHTLGSDELLEVGTTITITGSATMSLTGNGYNTTAIADSGFASSPRINLDSLVIGETYLFEGVSTLNSGALPSAIISNGDGLAYVVPSDGSFSFEFIAGSNNQIAYNGRDYTYDISVIATVKQITNPNSYLTYYDFTNGLVTVDNSLNTPSTKYILNTKTVNNIITHTTPWSASDWAKINNNPNLIGKLALETLGATKTIPELDMVMDAGASADSYYMCSEKSGAYLVNSRVAYGAEKVTGYSTTTFGDEIGTATPITNGVNIDIATIGTIGNRPTVFFAIDSIGDGSAYIFSFDYVVNSGVAIFVAMYTGTTTINFNQTLTGTGTFSFIVDNFTYDTHRTYFDGRNLFNLDIKNASLRKVSKTDIANYASTIRTNADLQQKGIQTTAFVTDGVGVPQSYSSNLLQFTGDGRYVDTGWIPDVNEDWTLEAVVYFIDVGAEQAHGTLLESATSRVCILIFNGTLFTRLGDLYSSGVSSAYSSYHHILMTYKASDKSYTQYVNGNLTSSGISTFTGTTEEFIIGNEGSSGGKKVNGEAGTFKVHRNRIFDAIEVATAYAQAKLIYPTLP